MPYTFYLEPNGTPNGSSMYRWDYGLGMDPGGEHHLLIDEGTRQPTIPGTLSTAIGGAPTSVCLLDVSSFILADDWDVTEVKAWALVRGLTPSGITTFRLTIFKDGVQQAQDSFNTNGSGTRAWGSLSWSSGALTQSEIDGLRLEIAVTAGDTGEFECVYLEVTVESTVEVTADKQAQYNVAPTIVASTSKTARYTVGTAPGVTTLSALADSYVKASSTPWRPKLRPGSFFLGTEEYYLYAGKRTKTLNEVTFSVFNLLGVPVHGSMAVTYDGITYTDWFVEGTELHLKHVNPAEWSGFYTANYADTEQAAWINAGYLGSPTNSISVTYNYLVWDNTTKLFTVTAGAQTFTIRDDEEERYYRLYDSSTTFERTLAASHDTHTRYGWYTPTNGPVVVTDDSIQNYDTRGIRQEFSLDTETSKLLLRENLLRNPGFLIVDGASAPYEWTAASGSLLTAVGAFPYEAAYGSRFLDMSVGQTAYQTGRPRDTRNHTVSFYARLPVGTASASVKVVLNPIGVAGDYINTSGVAIGTPYDNTIEVLTSTTAITGNAWTRYTVRFGTSNDFFTVDAGPIPDEAYKFETRFVAVGGAVDLDAVQLEEGYEAFPFNGLLGNSTIEYEGSPSENYVPNPTDPPLRRLLTAGYAIASGTNPTYPVANEYPFRRDEVDFNSAQSEMPNGFLCLQDDGGTTDFSLGKGGTSIYAAGTGPQDILGRASVPYAKLTGYNKLQARQTLRLLGAALVDELAPARETIEATDVMPIIPESSYMGPSSNPNSTLGATYVVSVTGTAVSNPPTDEELHVETKSGKTLELSVIFLDQFKNPVLGATCTVTHLGAAMTKTFAIKTDRAGRVRYTHTPQAGSSGTAAERVTFAIGSVTFTFMMDVL